MEAKERGIGAGNATPTVPETDTLVVYGDELEKTVLRKALFGWKLANDPRKKNRKGEPRHVFFMRKVRLVFTRDSSFPYHDKVVELEHKYEKADAERESYYPADPSNVFLLFVLLIIPGVVYLLVKRGKKRKAAKNNAEIDLRQLAYAAEARRILTAGTADPLLPEDDSKPKTAILPTSPNHPAVFRGKDETSAGPVEKAKAPVLPADPENKGEKLGKAPK